MKVESDKTSRSGNKNSHILYRHILPNTLLGSAVRRFWILPPLEVDLVEYLGKLREHGEHFLLHPLFLGVGKPAPLGDILVQRLLQLKNHVQLIHRIPPNRLIAS